MHGTGTFTFGDYEEVAYGEVQGGSKVTRSTVTNAYTGAIDGVGKQAYLGLYRGEDAAGAGTGVWVGLELVTGRVGDRQGSFAVEQRGTFDSAGVKGTWQVVADSGTGGLGGLRGEGGFTFTTGDQAATYTLTYELA